MSDQENPVIEGLYRLIAEDWSQLQTLRQATTETLNRLRTRIARALSLGAIGRDLARRTQVPETTVRRLGSTDLPEASETAGAA